jgi:hypothetical protein
MRRSSALGIAIVVMMLGVFLPAPVAADCQGGVVWPSLDRARGTTFVGVFEGVTTNEEDGNNTFHWTVERVYAGPLNTGPLDGWGIGYGCHATGYREGRHYLVSSRFAGGGDAFDTVAYELLGGGRVRLAPFPEQPRRTAPRVYRQVDTLRGALDLLVPKRAPRTSAPGSSPSFVPSGDGKARDDRLVLAITTDKSQVHEFETIPITTTLRYIGPVKRERATLYGPTRSLVAFQVEQLDGPIDTGPGWGPQCWYYRFGPDEVKDIPFEKSGGFDPSGPMAPFWKLWFADPVLRLPEGRYVITAYAHHSGRNGRCSAPRKTLTASVAIEVVAPAGVSPDLTTEPSGALAPGASPSSGPSTTPAVRTTELWSPVDLATLPWPYTCSSPAFRASAIAAPGGIPTEDPRLARLVQARGPDAHLLWADEDDAVVGVVVDGSPRARQPIYYHDLENVDGLWRAGGGEGDCQPWARFEQLQALGGRWRLDPAYPPPDRRSTVLHTLVTYPGCPTAVETRGRPRVATTDEAVVVVIPVVTTNTSDMCTPGKPSAVTIRLSEPLGDRTLYDAGTLPMREVRVAR